MISISTPTYDLDGTRVFYRASQTNTKDITQRVTRTKTLDGGVAIVNRGYVAGDRTITLEQIAPTKDDWTFCEYILNNYVEVVMSTKDGCFIAVPSALNKSSKNSLRLILLIKEQA